MISRLFALILTVLATIFGVVSAMLALEEISTKTHELRGGAEESPVMRIGEVVTREEGDLLTVWLWWAVPGTALEGAGLIKIAPTGVASERLTYFTKLEI